MNSAGDMFEVLYGKRCI